MENEYADDDTADAGLLSRKQPLPEEVETNESGKDGDEKEKKIESSSVKKQKNRDGKLNRFTGTCWFEYNCRINDDFGETSEDLQSEDEEKWESEDADKEEEEEEEDFIIEEPESPSAKKNHIDTEVGDMDYNRQSFSHDQELGTDELPPKSCI